MKSPPSSFQSIAVCMEKYSPAAWCPSRTTSLPASASAPPPTAVLPGNTSPKAAVPPTGCDTQGPTAVLLSNKHIKHEGYTERAARLLNIKWSPTALAGDEGTRKLMHFIRTWCDLRLWHVQFNVINKSTLEKAKADPAVIATSLSELPDTAPTSANCRPNCRTKSSPARNTASDFSIAISSV